MIDVWQRLNRQIPFVATLLILTAVGSGLFLLGAQPNWNLGQANSQPQPQDLSNFVEHSETIVYFYTPVYGNLSQTNVQIPFGFYPEDPIQILILGYSAQGDRAGREFVISHPDLDQLDWPSISSGRLTLYQKDRVYQNITDFIQNPPSLDRVAVDSYLTSRYSSLADAETTDLAIDFEEIDFVLTSYQSPSYINGVYTASRVIDTSNADLNDNNEIGWYIRAPANLDQENRYLLGQISVDFVQ